MLAAPGQAGQAPEPGRRGGGEEAGEADGERGEGGLGRLMSNYCSNNENSAQIAAQWRLSDVEIRTLPPAVILTHTSGDHGTLGQAGG